MKLKVIVKFNKEDVLTSKHLNDYNDSHASLSLSLSLYFDGISPTQSVIFELPEERKKEKNIKGSPHLDFHSRMSSMEFSRKANPSNSVKRTVWVCVFSIKKDYSITKTDPVSKASSEYTVW